MAVSITINVDDPLPQHGQIITAVYAVDGNDPIPASSGTVSGAGVIGGIRMTVDTTVTAPGTPAQTELFETPTCDLEGWVFTATSDPHVFTCTVP